MTLPNFIVIGAAKAGTTSMYHYLAAHPDVFMSETKELNFFTDKEWHRGRAWYEQQFAAAGAATAIGEASPRYTFEPSSGPTAERMASVIPDAKLIYVVRHPVKRLISHYQHVYHRPRKHAYSFEEAIRRSPVYVDASRYAYQLDLFANHFSKERMLVLTTERLEADPGGTLSRVWQFLGLEAPPASDHFERRFNVSTEKRGRPRALAGKVMRAPGVEALANALPSGAKRLGRKLSHRPLDKAMLSEEMQEELAERFADDVRSLYRYADADFDGWGIA